MKTLDTFVMQKLTSGITFPVITGKKKMSEFDKVRTFEKGVIENAIKQYNRF